MIKYALQQWSSTPGPWTSTRLWTIWYQDTQRIKLNYSYFIFENMCFIFNSYLVLFRLHLLWLYYIFCAFESFCNLAFLKHHVSLITYLETLHSKSMPLCKESTKQLADPNEDRECLAMSAPFISFSIARALLLTSCLKVLSTKAGKQY